MADLNELKNDYEENELNEADLLQDPFKQFDIWLEDAINEGLDDPNVMILSTVSESNRPSSRIVLLKEFNQKGFTFYSNYQSKKGKHLEKNSYGSLLFPWHTIKRQVRIEGKIDKISQEESDAYFDTRPFGSKIEAWISPQSEEIASRDYLVNQELKLKQKYEGKSVPRPSHWGGYRLMPDLFEFWQERENRLHDRFEFSLIKNKWIIRRLAP
ncbi:MAG: pyridoxamine 5'-phosphate oxidase [Bacteroidales bacterium]|nr:pyridoxamine 5'-phosphate oxidase [Bacteroidales bacterium]